MTRSILAGLVFSIFVAVPTPADEIYTVRPGDTLRTISTSFGVDAQTIARANYLSSSDPRPGSTLLIPDRGTAPPSAAPTASRSPRNLSDRKPARSEPSTRVAHGSPQPPAAPSEKRTESVTDRTRAPRAMSLAEAWRALASDRLPEPVPTDETGRPPLGPILAREAPVLSPGLCVRSSSRPATTEGESLSAVMATRSDRGAAAEPHSNLEALEELLDDLGPDPLECSEAEGSTSPATPPPLQPPTASGDEDRGPVPATAIEAVSSGIKNKLLSVARGMLGIPYRWGGRSLLGIDCSAYVQRVFNFLGIALPRTAREQYSLGAMIPREELSLGDLVFFRTYASFPSHVGIYIGDNEFIHAASRHRGVRIDNLDDPYFLRRFIGARRLIP